MVAKLFVDFMVEDKHSVEQKLITMMKDKNNNSEFYEHMQEYFDNLKEKMNSPDNSFETVKQEVLYQVIKVIEAKTGINNLAGLIKFEIIEVSPHRFLLCPNNQFTAQLIKNYGLDGLGIFHGKF